MKSKELKLLVHEIVKNTRDLKDKHTTARNTPVNYSCIFSKSQTEYKALLVAAHKIGKIIKETPTGPLFQIIPPLDTVAGRLQLLKIRKVDETRSERGDADFTVTDYKSFKNKYLPKPGFSLIKRPEMEIVELIDKAFDVRAYFSNPPLDKQFGLI